MKIFLNRTFCKKPAQYRLFFFFLSTRCVFFAGMNRLLAKIHSCNTAHVALWDPFVHGEERHGLNFDRSVDEYSKASQHCIQIKSPLARITLIHLLKSPLKHGPSAAARTCMLRLSVEIAVRPAASLSGSRGRQSNEGGETWR